MNKKSLYFLSVFFILYGILELLNIYTDLPVYYIYNYQFMLIILGIYLRRNIYGICLLMLGIYLYIDDFVDYNYKEAILPILMIVLGFIILYKIKKESKEG